MKELLADPNAWSEIAQEYDATARGLLTPFSEEALRWAHVTADDEVLDVAAGPGTMTMLAAEKAASVRAIDFAPEMITVLKRHARGHDNVAAMVGDGQSLPFDAERFTVAFSMFGLMFFPDPIAGLKEIHRVLRPGGRMIISSWVPTEASPMMMPMVSALQNALGPPPPNESAPEPFKLEDEASLKESLALAGFCEVEVRQHIPHHPIESAESYWHDMRENLFVTDVRKKLGPTWPDVERRVLDHLRETLRGVDTLAMPALLALGHKKELSS